MLDCAFTKLRLPGEKESSFTTVTILNNTLRTDTMDQLNASQTAKFLPGHQAFSTRCSFLSNVWFCSESTRSIRVSRFMEHVVVWSVFHRNMLTAQNKCHSWRKYLLLFIIHFLGVRPPHRVGEKHTAISNPPLQAADLEIHRVLNIYECIKWNLGSIVSNVFLNPFTESHSSQWVIIYWISCHCVCRRQNESLISSTHVLRSAYLLTKALFVLVRFPVAVLLLPSPAPPRPTHFLHCCAALCTYSIFFVVFVRRSKLISETKYKSATPDIILPVCA